MASSPKPILLENRKIFEVGQLRGGICRNFCRSPKFPKNGKNHKSAARGQVKLANFTKIFLQKHLVLGCIHAKLQHLMVCRKIFTIQNFFIFPNFQYAGISFDFLRRKISFLKSQRNFHENSHFHQSPNEFLSEHDTAT